MIVTMQNIAILCYIDFFSSIPLYLLVKTENFKFRQMSWNLSNKDLIILKRWRLYSFIFFLYVYNVWPGVIVVPLGTKIVPFSSADSYS